MAVPCTVARLRGDRAVAACSGDCSCVGRCFIQGLSHHRLGPVELGWSISKEKLEQPVHGCVWTACISGIMQRAGAQWMMRAEAASASVSVMYILLRGAVWKFSNDIFSEMAMQTVKAVTYESLRCFVWKK